MRTPFVSVRHYSNFSNIIKKCIVAYRKECPHIEYLRRLDNMKLKLETHKWNTLWTTSVKHIRPTSYSFKISLLSASSIGLQKNLAFQDTSQTVGHNLTIACYHNPLGIVNFLKWALWNIWDFCMVLLRIIELAFIFTPVLILYPITILSSHLKTLWYRLFLFGLEFSGPIFVKVGQWASTRRDLFPEEFCQVLSKLQRKTRAHSWFYTKYCLEKAFGPEWRQIFVKFDNNYNPVGSGCCAQVYKVWIEPSALSLLNGAQCNDCPKDSLFVEGVEMFGLGSLLGTKDRGQPSSIKAQGKIKELNDALKKDLILVAMKVRHPRMEVMLRRDLLILKSMASTVTWMFPSLKWLSLVDCIEDFSLLMKAQVDLCIEASNLDKFSANFEGIKSVKFPRPVWPLTRSYLLVETYEEGQPMQNYVTNKSTNQINIKLAELGINTILKMKNSDSVQIKASKSFFPFSKSSSSTFPVNLVILDCGITVSLDDRGKKCLKALFAAVADGDGEKAGKLFLEHSNHQCNDPESFKSKMNEILSSALKKNVTLEQIEVSSLLSSLFSTMIDHKVKLDGSFSSIILAIMVLEGLGRSLDPNVDLIEKARPFLISSL
ncbi:hypothetical protein C0J52_18218 [Blattella germanica]|nr:hypothetical protein C0J52_18218 [Blattella germanica]